MIKCLLAENVSIQLDNYIFRQRKVHKLISIDPETHPPQGKVYNVFNKSKIKPDDHVVS